MSALSKRNSIIVLGLLFIIAISVGASRKKQSESLDLGVSEDDLDVLGDSLEALEFDDFVGLSDGNGLGISEEDLNSLEDALKNLDFQDLEGLSDN